jgi:nuclear pore complex protein Nup153
VLTEIIEKVTPPAKPDLSNPYQNASPVKVGIRREKRKVSGSGGVSSSTAKPAVPAVKARDFAKESSEMDVDNLSEKAKIEATVPKVSN